MVAIIDSYNVLGADEVCKICDFSKVHLNRLIKDKKIPAKKISRSWIFAREDVLAFQKARREKAKTDKRVKLK